MSFEGMSSYRSNTMPLIPSKLKTEHTATAVTQNSFIQNSKLIQMTVAEGKEKFIQSWGALGSNWGINRTMAQIHALLLVSVKPLSTDDIRKELKISLGNANMNIRALIDWGLAYKTMISGERKDYFIAEKDMGKVVKQIIIQRKKKELDPMIKVLDEISAVDSTEENAEEFLAVVKDIRTLSEKADKTLDKLVRKESEWLVNAFMKLM